MTTFMATRFAALAIGTGALAAACTLGPGDIVHSNTPTTQPGTVTTTLAVEECPVTVPGSVPSSEPWREELFGYGSAYGNGQLWVGGLGLNGVIQFETASDGWKLGWWRAVSGDLRITGRRLDAAAPPLRSTVSRGYGDIGFQSSGVYFPTAGCWEVTGTAGTARLTFVTLVND
jgi:hypothetical protein